MSGTRKHGLKRPFVDCCIAVAAVALAFLWRHAMVQYFGHELPPYVTFLPALMVGALTGGVWAGLLATAVAAVLAAYWILPPHGQFAIQNTSDAVGLALFTAMGVFVSVVAELYRRARERAVIFEKNLAVKESNAALRNLEAVTDATLAHLPLQDLLPQLLKRTAEVLRADMAVILLLNEQTQMLEVRATLGLEEEASNKVGIPFGKGIAGTIARTGQLRIIDSLAEVEVFSPILRARAASLIGAPLSVEGHVIGVIHVDSAKPRKFTTAEATLLQIVADRVALSIDRARRGEALRQTLEQRKLALEAADLGSWDYRLNTGEVFWDERCRDMFGVPTGGQIDYDEAIARIHPEDRSGVDQAVKQAVAGTDGGAYHREFRVVWPDGSIHWVASHGRVYFEGSGDERRAVRFIGANLDITERKRADEALRASQKRWAITLHSIGDAVLTSDALGRVTYLNPSAEALTGWTVADALGQPVQAVFRIINAKTGKPAEDIVAQALRERHAVALANNTVLVTRQGQEIPIEDSAAPITDESGNVAGVVLVFHDVTERRRAQEALRTSEERYRSLVELSPVAIFVNRDNRVEFANPAACDLFGAAAPEQLYGKTPFDLFHPDCHAIVRQRIERVSAGERGLLIEEKIVRLDGTVREVEVASSRFVDETGPAIQVILRDITERKHREQQLKRLYRTLQALNNSNQALLHATDETALLQKVCQIVTEDCGYAMVWIGFAENDANKTVRPVAHAGFEEGYLETLRLTWADTERGRGPTGTAIRAGKPCLCRNMLSDPRLAPWRQEALKRGYSSSLVVPLMSLGKAFGALTIYSREPDPFSEDEIKLLSELAGDLAHGITALRFRAANEQAQQALREGEARLRLALDAAKSGTWEWDLRTGKNTWSDELWALYDREPHSFEPSYAAWRQIVHPEDRAMAERTVLEAARNGAELNVEFRVVERSGGIRWLMARGRPLHDERGHAIRYTGIVLDISERKRAEQALLQNEKLASVGRMAATIAHEINNPLAAVMNTIFLAQSSTDARERQRYLELADEELKRVSHITHQALGFYRESSIPVAGPIGPILDSAIDLLRSRIKAKRATIEKQYGSTLQISAVGGELRQVFSNLLANSLDAISDHGIIKLRASSYMRGGKSCVRVTIADNGKGIDPGLRSRIFEPLFTTKDSTGTGLGLWVTRQLVEKHGGSIRVHSRTDGLHQGTAFSIVLPAEAEVRAGLPAARGQAATASTD